MVDDGAAWRIMRLLLTAVLAVGVDISLLGDEMAITHIPVLPAS
jgi:hypothetical protein